MKQFLEAFGGLIGIALIAGLVLAFVFLADWLMERAAKARQHEREERPRKK